MRQVPCNQFQHHQAYLVLALGILSVLSYRSPRRRDKKSTGRLKVKRHLTEPPHTYVVDAEGTRDNLDYDEMIALSGMFRRWAIYEPTFSPEQRTELMTWSADYERIAAWVGKGWRAPPSPSPDIPLYKFIARLERDASGAINMQHAKHWLGLD